MLQLISPAAQMRGCVLHVIVLFVDRSRSAFVSNGFASVTWDIALWHAAAF
jgi:hypothetical protein